MSVHTVVIESLLGIVVLTAWLGVIGMLRMRTPTQMLHYMTLPATIGAFALTAAVFVDCGWCAAGVKALLITLVLLGINSVVTHATARAFRTREVGHWEPRDGDPLDFVPSTHHVQGERRP